MKSASELFDHDLYSRVALSVPSPLWIGAAGTYAYVRTGSLNVVTLDISLLEFLKTSGKTLIRWGDGESQILLGRSIHFQDADRDLRSCLLKILRRYNRDAPYLLALPVQFLNMDTYRLQEIGKLHVWQPSRLVFRLFCPKKIPYADSLAFRPDKLTRWTAGEIDPEPLWASVENIVLVHHDRNVYEEFRQRYAEKSIFWAPIPERNAFAEYSNILCEIYAVLENNVLTHDNCRILLSAGPTAKILAYDLSPRYVCYDLGYFFEFDVWRDGSRRS